MRNLKRYWWILTHYKRYRKLNKIFNTPSHWPITRIDVKEFIDSMQPVLDKIGSDYDENGIPYWEKWEKE